MHDQLVAVSLILFVYAALALAYFGWGVVTARVLRLTTSSGGMLVWLGWAVALLIFQVLHLFFPLNTDVIAPVFLSGIALSIPRLVLFCRGLRFERGTVLRIAGLAVVIVVAAAWLASRSMVAPRSYDTGLYHLNASRWINSFPIVPGLGNLHGRLAFNQAFFTYAASLNVAPLFANGSRIANSFLFLLTADTFLARLRPVAARPALLRQSPFEYLPSLFALPILGYLALSPALTAPTPDLALDLLQLVMVVTLAGVVRRRESSVDETALLAILAATAITIELSNLAFTLAVLAIAFFLARRTHHVLRAVALVMMVLSVWIARGYVSSGMPLYPSTLGSVAFDWSVPRDEAAHMAGLIRGSTWFPRLGKGTHVYLERETIGEISLAGWQPIPRAPLLPRSTASGLDVLMPATGDQCWDAALLCTPYARDDLRLRVPGHLESGFAVTPPSSIRGKDARVLNLRNFGAAGDGRSDDGPALQRALDALATLGGGTLFVPPGSYAIATPVARDFSAKASAVVIAGKASSTAIDVAGNGSGLNLTSEFIIKVGQDHVALALGVLDSLSIRDIAFTGVPNVRDDAQVVLAVNDIGRVHIEHCEFYGLASLLPGGAIVAAHKSGLNVDRTAFLGCATNSAHSASMIQNVSWKDIAVTNAKFIDYGNRPNFFSKTPTGTPYSWIGIGDAEAVQPTSFRRDAVIRNVFLDEGGWIGITARRDLTAPASTPFNVFISTIQMNVSNLATCGIHLSGVDKVLIESSHLGWSHNADAAVILKDVNEAILDRLECLAHANTIRADADTERLMVVNSTYQTLDSAAPYTKTIVTPEDPVQSVRKQYLHVLGAEPELNVLYFWASQMLKCEGDPSCLVEQRSTLAKYLSAARKTRLADIRD